MNDKSFSRTNPLPVLQLERSPLLHVGFQALDAFQVGAAFRTPFPAELRYLCLPMHSVPASASAPAQADRRTNALPLQAAHGGRLPEPGNEAEADELVAQVNARSCSTHRSRELHCCTVMQPRAVPPAGGGRAS